MPYDVPIRTRCGMRCDFCPAFGPNRTGANLQRASIVWAEVFDVHIPPEAIACGGCRGRERDLLDQECPVRPCVLAKGLDDCGQCPDMPCDTLLRRWVSREEVEATLGRSLTEDDYRRYVLPFENAPYLSARVGRSKTAEKERPRRG
ncbi:DUF3795 domain-containing protein [Candidatus Fermentibacteria bacterium]|nr:DUF3795 domain-containing protein [Candidatus Fermentibacteria bacterium]